MYLIETCIDYLGSILTQSYSIEKSGCASSRTSYDICLSLGLLNSIFFITVSPSKQENSKVYLGM